MDCRDHRTVWILFALIGTSCFRSGCANQNPLAAQAVKPTVTPALFETGKQLYQKQCAVCHGPRGSGDGLAAYLLYPKPRDFTQNKFRLVSTSTGEATEEDLFLTITRGMPGSAMPSWETLTPQERWALVYYVCYLAREPQGRRDGRIPETMVTEEVPWSVREALITGHHNPQEIIQVPPESPKTSEGIERGRQFFAEACASCHGPLGKGDAQQRMISPPTASAEGGSAPEAQALRAAVGGGMTDDAGFPIRPRNLTAGVFKGSSESRDLYHRIVAGLPGSPMPSYAGVYTDEQLWDLIHYIQSLVPPGAEERVRMHPQTIPAHHLRGELPSDAAADAWRKIDPVTVALTPLWWRDDRIESVEVKALYNGKELAIHLAWKDQTLDQSTLTPQTFSDGVAIQLSSAENPPFFGMGGAEGAVHIWHWKASWQEDTKAWCDLETAYPNAAVDWYQSQQTYRRGEPFEVSQAKTAEQDPNFMSGWGAGNPLSDPRWTSAAEEAMAKGLGTLTSRPPEIQKVQANGVWKDGQWQVVLRRPISAKTEDDLKLQPGQKISVAFALFDGHAGDRNGQKNVSIWHILKLER